MKTILTLFLSAVVSATVMWPLFLGQPQLAPVLEDPQHVVFSQGGDAWKNIYTVAYHTLYDDSLIETQAFNYPDGEHIAFADGQPVLTWVLKGFGVEHKETVFAVVQLLPFVGCIFGAVLLTWLLLRLRMPLVYAILFGIGIALLSPQMTRTTGHFGLSYVFALPLLLHLLMNWAARRSWNDVGWLILAIVCLGQLHLYLLASGLLMSCTFMVFSQWLGWKGSGLRVFAQIVTLAFVSYGVTKGIVDFTWIVADRPAAPYGLKAFVSSWEDVLIDRSLPWWSWFSSHVSKIRKPGGFEGLGYVGITSGIFILYLFLKYVLVRIVSYPFRDKSFAPIFRRVASEDARKFLVILSLVAATSFIIASGILLHIPGFELVLDKLGAVRQFRSLGRFVWIFYYAIQLVSAVVITSWCLAQTQKYESQGSSAIAIVFRVLPIVFGVLLAWEGNRGLSTIYSNIPTQDFPVEKWQEAIGDNDKYQAILPIPYFHEGSENYNALARYGQIGPSTVFSLQTGLPNMGVMMSRQSGALSRERLGLNSPWVAIPPVLLKLDSVKPVLILAQRTTMRENEMVNSTHDFKPWFAEVDTLYIDDETLIMSFLPSKINLDKVLNNYCKDWMTNATPVAELDNRIYTNMMTQIGWDLEKDIFSSSGSGFNELHRWERPRGIDSAARETLVVSWLAYIGEDGYVFNEYELRCTDWATGNTEVIALVKPLISVVQYVGDWAQMQVVVPANTKGEEFSLWGKMARHPKVHNLAIRNIVTRPVDATVVWKTGSGSMIDGLLLRACD